MALLSLEGKGKNVMHFPTFEESNMFFSPKNTK